MIFYDSMNQKWQTNPITYNADCSVITSILENLPNQIIPKNSVLCTKWNRYHSIDYTFEPIILNPQIFYGIKYTIAFPKNPGRLKQIDLNMYLDGTRPTLYTNESLSTLGSFVYPNGFTGETNDYFIECIGVITSITFTTDNTQSYYYLYNLLPIEIRLLQRCLGLSNDYNYLTIKTGKIEGISYEWDYGSIYNPHIIKLVDQTSNPITALCPGSLNSIHDGIDGPTVTCIDNNSKVSGFYAILYYNLGLNRFIILNRPGVTYSITTKFAIFTTNGYTQMISKDSKIITNTNINQLYSKTVISINSTNLYQNYIGNIDCETNSINMNGAFDCLEKNDLVFIIDPYITSNNPQYINIYQINRIYKSIQSKSISMIEFDKSINFQYINNDNNINARIYKFIIPKNSIKYVSECSNRGICDNNLSICNCFEGFEGDSCQIQSNKITQQQN